MRTRGGWSKVGRAGSLEPPQLEAWLAMISAADPALEQFADDVALIVRHGLPPRAAVAALLRAVADDVAANRGA